MLPKSEGPAIFENKTQSKLSEILKEEVQRISEKQTIKEPTFQVNLFSDEPPELDFPTTTVDRTEKTTAPLNLFLDSDDDSIFDAEPKPSISSSKKSFMSNKSNKVLPSLGTENMAVKVQTKHSSDEQDSGSIKTSRNSVGSKQDDNKKTISSESQQIKKTTVNLFDDDDYDSFMNVLDQAKPTKPNEKVNISSIFDDEPPDDLFDVLIAANKKSTKRNIFDDADDQGNDRSFDTQIVPEKRNDSVLKIKNIFDDNDDVDDFGLNVDQQTESKTQSKKDKSAITEKKEDLSARKTNLFDEDDSDPLFKQNIKVESKQIVEKSSATEQKNDFDSKGKNIFDDLEDVEDKSKILDRSHKTENLFDDMDNDDRKPISSQSTKTNTATVKTKNLFDDYDDFDDEYEKLFEKSKINELKKTEKQIDEMESPKNEPVKLFDALPSEPTENSNQLQETERPDQTSKENKKPTPSWIDSLNFDQPPDDDVDDQGFDSKMLSRQSIFEDEDDENIFSKPVEKEQTNIVQKENSKTQKTFDFSSSIGLFDDIPPPDDGDVDDNIDQPSTNEPSLPDIFDDDGFNDTESRQEQKSTTPAENEFIFDEEPPPDDEPITVDCDEIDRSSESFQRKLSIFSQSESLEDNKNSSIDSTITDQIKPKKLKTNLNINVKALLPGARGPLNKTSSNETKPPNDDFTEPKDPDEDEQNFDSFYVPALPGKKTDLPESEIIDQSIPTVLPQSSDRLISLSKSRAKIPIPRRQSTRKGRQDQYRKSLIMQNETEEIVESKEIESQRRDSKHSNDLVIQSDSLGNKVLLDSGTPIKKSFVFYNDEDISSSTTLEGDANQHKPIDSSLNRDSFVDKLAVSVESTKLFRSDDDLDIFSTTKTVNTKLKLSKETKEMIKDLPTLENEPSKKTNIFDALKDPLISNSPLPAIRPFMDQSNLSQQTDDIEIIKSKEKSIFDDDDENFLFPNATSKIDRKNSQPTKPVTMEKKKTSLFSDEEEEDDDSGLFSVATKTQVKI